MLNDEQFAEQTLNMPDVDVPRERLAEWSPNREGMARIEDAVRALNVTMIAINSKTPPKFQPAVRPITATDRLRSRRRRTDHDSLVARVLPGQS